jgi:diphthine-ammonia ligase
MMSNAIQLNGTDKGKAVVSWTGGKDGCYACYKAMAEGYQITHLLNFRNMKNTGRDKLTS